MIIRLERRVQRLAFAIAVGAFALISAPVACAQDVNPNPTAIDPPPPENFVPGEVLVRLRPGTSEQARDQTLAAVDGVFVRDLDLDDVVLANVPVGTELEAAESLQIDPNVVFAEPNGRVEASATGSLVE